MIIRNKNKGFTLIELMIVVAIISILAAIAVPSFMAYRERSYDKKGQTVLKNICSAQSAYSAKYETYTTLSTSIMAVDPNIPASSTDLIEWSVTAATTTGFLASSRHNLGSGSVYNANQSSVITIN